MSTLKQKRASAAAAKEDLNVRATEAANALRVPIPMRKAAYELIFSRDYEKAAKKAGVMPDDVREWAYDLRFIAAIGWFVIGLTDNHE